MGYVGYVGGLPECQPHRFPMLADTQAAVQEACSNGR